jgi:hypothetical protein
MANVLEGDETRVVEAVSQIPGCSASKGLCSQYPKNGLEFVEILQGKLQN